MDIYVVSRAYTLSFQVDSVDELNIHEENAKYYVRIDSFKDRFAYRRNISLTELSAWSISRYEVDRIAKEIDGKLFPIVEVGEGGNALLIDMDKPLT